MKANLWTELAAEEIVGLPFMLPNDAMAVRQAVRATVSGIEADFGNLLRSAMSLHLTSNATFDIGTDLDSPVSLDYYDQAPFAFNGGIGMTRIEYTDQ